MTYFLTLTSSEAPNAERELSLYGSPRCRCSLQGVVGGVQTLFFSKKLSVVVSECECLTEGSYAVHPVVKPCFVARTLRGCPPSTEGGSRGDRARRMDPWLAVLCELHKRNPLSGAPSDAEHVQSVACDAPLTIGAPSGSVAHCSAYFPGHQTPPGALPDLPSTTIAPSSDAFQPKM